MDGKGGHHDRLVEGDFDGKGRSAALLALGRHRAAHALGQPFRDGEAQPRPAKAPRDGGVGLDKLGKQVRDAVGGDADARVLDADGEAARRGRREHDVDAAPLGELDGVGEQVEYDLPQPVGVENGAVGHAGPRAQRQVEAALARRRLDHAQGFLDDGKRRGRHGFEFDAPRLDFREVENVADDGEQGAAAGLDDADALALARVERREAQQFGHAHDAVEGRADFVAHRRQKLAFGAGTRLGLVARHFEFAHRHAQRRRGFLQVGGVRLEGEFVGVPPQRRAHEQRHERGDDEHEQAGKGAGPGRLVPRRHDGKGAPGGRAPRPPGLPRLHVQRVRARRQPGQRQLAARHGLPPRPAQPVAVFKAVGGKGEGRGPDAQKGVVGQAARVAAAGGEGQQRRARGSKLRGHPPGEQPAAPVHPQAPRPVEHERARRDRQAGHPVGAGKVRDGALPVAVEAARRPDPEGAAGADGKGAHLVGAQRGVRNGIALQALGPPDVQPVRRAQPVAARRARGDIHHVERPGGRCRAAEVLEQAAGLAGVEVAVCRAGAHQQPPRDAAHHVGFRIAPAVYFEARPGAIGV